MKALITGAASGIGKEISLYLSILGYDLYVVDLNKDKLISIYKKCKVKVNYYQYDLTNMDNCHKLYNEVKSEKIDLLINNAGFGDFGNFTETNLEKEMKMIDLNIKAYHTLTKLFLKDFVKRNHGRILNIASMAGFMPGPYMACYYATKSYIVNLSLAIYEELKKDNSNVKISIFCPGPVDTNFENKANVKFNIKLIGSKDAARYAINNMLDNKLIIVPSNMKLNRLLVKIMPTKMILFINSFIQERYNLN